MNTENKTEKTPVNPDNKGGSDRVGILLVLTFGQGGSYFKSFTRNHGARDTAEIVIAGSLATFDHDELTRLVILAHLLRVRVQIESGPEMNLLKLKFQAREHKPTKWTAHHPGYNDFERAIAELREEVGHSPDHVFPGADANVGIVDERDKLIDALKLQKGSLELKLDHVWKIVAARDSEIAELKERVNDAERTQSNARDQAAAWLKAVRCLDKNITGVFQFANSGENCALVAIESLVDYCKCLEWRIHQGSNFAEQILHQEFAKIRAKKRAEIEASNPSVTFPEGAR